MSTTFMKMPPALRPERVGDLPARQHIVPAAICGANNGRIHVDSPGRDVRICSFWTSSCVVGERRSEIRVQAKPRHHQGCANRMCRCNHEPLGGIRLLVRSVVALGMLVAALAASPSRAADGPIRLEVVAGVSAVRQYTNFEAPHYTHDVPQLTQGRVRAGIHPFDESGLSGREM